MAHSPTPTRSPGLPCPSNRVRGCATSAVAPSEGSSGEEEPLSNLLGGCGVTAGVMTIAAPGVSNRVSGLNSTPSSRAVTRAWGTRNLTLAVLAMRAPDEARDEWTYALALMNGLDAALNLIGMRDGIPRRVAIGSAALPAVVAALLLVARSLDRR